MCLTQRFSIHHSTHAPNLGWRWIKIEFVQGKKKRFITHNEKEKQAPFFRVICLLIIFKRCSISFYLGLYHFFSLCDYQIFLLFIHYVAGTTVGRSTRETMRSIYRDKTLRGDIPLPATETPWTAPRTRSAYSHGKCRHGMLSSLVRVSDSQRKLRQRAQFHQSLGDYL